jgi:hypothetical protein
MEKENKPNNDALIAAMQCAWQDHHHARNQTWKVLQMEAVLGAGLVTVDVQFGLPLATSAAAILVIVSSIVGIVITLRHRELERRKFIHIMNCEEELGLHRNDILPLKGEAILDLGVDSSEYETRQKRRPKEEIVHSSEVAIPSIIRLWDIILLWKGNTSLFILRMHVALGVFSAIIMILRIINGPII